MIHKAAVAEIRVPKYFHVTLTQTLIRIVDNEVLYIILYVQLFSMK